MPPRKQPQSLVSLSVKATVKLIHQSALNIEDRAAPECTCHSVKAGISVHFVQQMLLRFISPRSTWDLVTEAVDSYIANDGCIVRRVHDIMCSIFVHPNTRKLRLLFPVQRWYSHDHTERYHKLINLVELDISSLCEESLLASIGTECINLEIIKFRAIAIFEDVLNLVGCEKLRIIKYVAYSNNQLVSLLSQHLAAKTALTEFPLLEHYGYIHMGEVLSSLTEPSPLNLRYVQEDSCTASQLTTIIALCPNLESLNLTMSEDEDNCKEIFHLLSTSSLELRNLEVTLDHSEYVEYFLDVKGIYLYKLSVHCRRPFSPCMAQTIARICKNLINLSLELGYDYSFNDGNPKGIDLDNHESVLTKLKYFRCISDSKDFDLTLFTTILPKSSDIESMSIVARKLNINKTMEGLLAAVSMPCLGRLEIEGVTLLSVKTVRGFYKKFPKLTYLDLSCAVKAATHKYLAKLREEVKLKNLDLVISGGWGGH